MGSEHDLAELSLMHLQAKLARLDVILHRQVRLWQLAGQDPNDSFRGLYIPDTQVNGLMARRLCGYWGEQAHLTQAELEQISQASEAVELHAKVLEEAAQRQGQPARLTRLAQMFDLDRFDVDVLLICLAPELDLRYERIYGYLQDDITRRRPSVDLVLSLLCSSFEERQEMRQRFSSNAPLLRGDLVVLFQDPSQRQPPLLSQCLKVDERIVGYLLNSDEPDGRLQPCARRLAPRVRLEDLLLTGEEKGSLLRLACQGDGAANAPIFYLQGPYGVGKQTAAEALCAELGLSLLVLDVERALRNSEQPFERLVRLSGREAWLSGSALYWDGFDALLADERQEERKALIQVLEGHSRLVFLAGASAWVPVDALHNRPFIQVELPRPTCPERAELWARSMGGSAPQVRKGDLEVVAEKFRLSGGQICDAAATARNLACWRDPVGSQVTAADLHAACRLHSNRKLETLALKIRPHYTWQDIILPPERMEQLREICNTVKHRGLVLEAWGFEQKLSLGKGLNILFAGPSGTGKTMAAEVMANELGLEMYKIDLSGVVSKYVGETEKNLARIFGEAETSNAILFFDEADALFGKRSEVRDAHDRYANIEISYLLQKMEEYEGVTILATNLRKNLDEAFVRRMHFMVEFPFPDQASRQRIWEQVWPVQTPRSPDLDTATLARRFELTGGNIRNIALAAAYLAAGDGRVVDMGCLLRATRREYQKMGKVAVESEFEAGEKNR